MKAAELHADGKVALFAGDAKDGGELLAEELPRPPESSHRDTEKCVQCPTLFARSTCGDDTHAGEVLHVAKSYAWVKPLGRVPPEIEAKLSAMNAEMRACAVERKQPFCGGATDTVVYVAFADIKDNNLVLEVGKLVLFKFWQDSRGVGGCEVTSASPSLSSLPAGGILLAESPKSARRKSYRKSYRIVKQDLNNAGCLV